jgi:hypothetical protein
MDRLNICHQKSVKLSWIRLLDIGDISKVNKHSWAYVTDLEAMAAIALLRDGHRDVHDRH